MAKKRKVRLRGKKERPSSVSSKKSEKFEIKGGVATRKKSCPKCGPGIFLAEHKNRIHCGKCGYGEFKK